MNRIGASSRGKYPRTYLVGVIEIESFGETVSHNGSNLAADATLKQVLARLSGAVASSNSHDRYIFPASRIQANLEALARELSSHSRRLSAALEAAAR